MRLSWPLIGRSEEMRTLESVILASDCSGIVVSGAAGVGKSRIAREALSAAALHGCEGRLAVGTSSARAIPLGAFTAWAQPGVTDTVELLRRAIESVSSAASGTPVVVAVDDVHLLDDLSTFVVQQIVQRGAAKVMLTVLNSEPIPAAVREIWKLGQFDRLDLQPLSLDETSTLVSATLDGLVDPDAAQRLWKLTRGNVLYLRNIVEQEVADGRIVRQHGYWRWIGDPVMPPGLVELIESRIGALPRSVSDVVDALAIGEPIELATLRRITDPAAVEEADTRGLITLDPVAGGVEVRVAHPLYGEVRRRRAPSTRLRRLRGLVAGELAASDDRDDIRVVVRRATLSLDSDLTPDADLLVRAAYGAVWLADLTLADRLAEAAMRAGAGPETSFVRAHALSWLSRGQEAEAVLSEIRTSELTDADHARFAFLRASNMLWALADPARAKELIDEASRTTPLQARSYIDAFLTVYWFAMDQPSAAMEASKQLTLDELPEVAGAEIAWVRAVIFADAGRTNDAVAAAEAGYTDAARSFDAPQMRFNIADAHISALLLSGRVRDALDVAERVRRQAADLPGRLNYSAPRWQVGPPLVPATSIPHACCWNRQQAVCPPRATASAGAIATRSHASPRSPCVVQLTRQLPRMPRSTSCNVAFGRWTTSEAWRGRGSPRARAPSVRRSPSCCRRPKRLQPAGNLRRKWSVCRPPPSSVIAPARLGCTNSNRSSRGHALASLPGSPRPCATATPLN